MLNRTQTNTKYEYLIQEANKHSKMEITLRELAKNDLFFLLTRICKRKDIDNDWLYERCREVQTDPNNCLDLWARFHYKSTIITFGLSILDILNNPEVTIGIFAYKQGLAKSFLKQIKLELKVPQCSNFQSSVLNFSALVRRRLYSSLSSDMQHMRV